MTLRRFANAIRILWNLDEDDVPFLSSDQWDRFCDDQTDFFIRASDDVQQKLWAAVEARQPKESMN